MAYQPLISLESYPAMGGTYFGEGQNEHDTPEVYKKGILKSVGDEGYGARVKSKFKVSHVHIGEARDSTEVQGTLEDPSASEQTRPHDVNEVADVASAEPR